MTAKITRPLLAGKVEDFSKINYPVYATPKLDGIRVMKVDGQTVTRKFKELPNKSVRAKLNFLLPDGMDGEVMTRITNVVGDHSVMFEEGTRTVTSREATFNEIQSQIMSFDGEPDFILYLFDYVKDSLDKPYLERVADLQKWFDDVLLKAMVASKIPMGVTTVDPENFKDKIRLIIPKQINDEEELLHYEQRCLKLGFEGVMIRKGDGKYKCGRSTEKESILLKLKRFEDSEAEVLGFTEKLRNDNIQEEDEFGLSKRSHKKEGLVPADTLGALVVKDIKSSVEFEVGSGFDDATKKEIWTNQSKYLGKTIKYKFQPVGIKDKPRFPVFLGFRHIDDI